MCQGGRSFPLQASLPSLDPFCFFITTSKVNTRRPARRIDTLLHRQPMPRVSAMNIAPARTNVHTCFVKFLHKPRKI